MALVAFAVLALTAGLAWSLNRDDLPPRPPAFRAPPAAHPVNVYEVKEAGASGLLLASVAGTDLRVPRPAAVDTVASGGSLKAGDWVNVAGIVDEVRNFSIRAIFVLSEHGKAGPDGVARTAAGFSGIETRRDPAERIILGGEVVSVAGETATLSGPMGETTLTITKDAQLFRVERGDPANIRAGDRLASTIPASPNSALPAAIVTVQAP